MSVLSDAASIYSSIDEGGAADDAYSRMVSAISNLRQMDPTALSNMVLTGDQAAYTNRMDFARQQEPGLSAIRQSAIDKLTSIYGASSYPWEAAQNSLADLTNESTSKSQDLENSLRTKAQQQLDLGGSLGPDFQQELVRSGLESGSQTGIGTAKGGPLAQVLGQQLGSAQIALENMRMQQAESLGAAADTMKQNRASILEGALPSLMDTTKFNIGLGEEGLNLFNTQIPQIGLNGQQQAGLSEQARNEANDQALNLAGVRGQRDVTGAAYRSQLAHASASTLSDLATMYMSYASGGGGMSGMMSALQSQQGGGGGAGGSSGGGGGTGSILSGLFGGSQGMGGMGGAGANGASLASQYRSIY